MSGKQLERITEDVRDNLWTLALELPVLQEHVYPLKDVCQARSRDRTDSNTSDGRSPSKSTDSCSDQDDVIDQNNNRLKTIEQHSNDVIAKDVTSSSSYASKNAAKPKGQIRAGLRSLYCDKQVRVKFVNHSGKEVQLYWINYIGECERAFKILDGRSEVIDTFETHPWIAANARNKKVHHAFTVNNNLVYYPVMAPAPAKYAVAEIRRAPEKLADLVSQPNDVDVTVKFINRTSRSAFLEMISSEGDRQLKHTLGPGERWTVVTQEKTYWITTMSRETDEGLLLNYGWYYSPTKSRLKKERVYVTDYI